MFPVFRKNARPLSRNKKNKNGLTATATPSTLYHHVPRLCATYRRASLPADNKWIGRGSRERLTAGDAFEKCPKPTGFEQRSKRLARARARVYLNGELTRVFRCVRVRTRNAQRRKMIGRTMRALNARVGREK